MSVNVVLGAGGPTGLECVKRLLAVTDLPVRAVVRDPSKHQLQDKLPDAGARLQVVAGDVTDPASLQAALQGAKGVIFAASGNTYWSAKPVDNQGVANTAAAAKAAGASRVVLVSSMLTHPANRLHPIRVLLNNIRWSLMDHKYAGEEALRKSGVPYTIIRPGGLTNNEGGKTQMFADAETTKEIGTGSITRADVAAVCVDALTNPNALNRTFSIYTKGQALPEGVSHNDHLGLLFSQALARAALAE